MHLHFLALYKNVIWAMPSCAGYVIWSLCSSGQGWNIKIPPVHLNKFKQGSDVSDELTPLYSMK